MLAYKELSLTLLTLIIQFLAILRNFNNNNAAYSKLLNSKILLQMLIKFNKIMCFSQLFSILFPNFSKQSQKAIKNVLFYKTSKSRKESLKKESPFGPIYHKAIEIKQYTPSVSNDKSLPSIVLKIFLN